MNTREIILLWKQFKGGNTLALGSIFDQYVKLLYSYGLQITADIPLVEDSIQDVFAELWEKRDRIGEVVSIQSYLCAALRRRILRKLKASRKQNEIQVYELWDVAEETSYEKMLIHKQTTEEQKKTLQKFISRLTPQQRKVIHLKFFQHLSYDEIAMLLSLNKRTVYNIISSAISQLQKYFAKSPWSA